MFTMREATVHYARKSKFGSLELHAPSELRGKKGMVLVVAGRGNAGKTTLLNTLWDSKNVKTVLVVDARGRPHVLEDRDGLSIVRINAWTDVVQVFTALKHEPNAFDVVVFDTYSEIQALDLKQRGLYEAADAMRLKIYGDSHMDMSDRTRTLYDLATGYGVHIILNTWVKPFKDAKTGTDMTKLYLTGQFEDYFRSIVDYIAELKLGDAPRPYPPVLNFTVSNTTPQKFSPAVQDAEMLKLPRVHYNPSLGHILDAFLGEPFPVELHKAGRSA